MIGAPTIDFKPIVLLVLKNGKNDWDCVPFLVLMTRSNFEVLPSGTVTNNLECDAKLIVARTFPK